MILPCFLERVEQAIPNGGGYEFLEHFSWDIEDKVKYIKIAANQGYAPAMRRLFLYERGKGDEGAIKWANKAMKLGYHRAAYSLYVIYRNNSDDKASKAETIELLKKAFYYSVVSALLKGGDYENWITTRTLRDDQGNKVLDENGYSMKEVLITKAEQAEIEQQAKVFLEGVETNLFLNKNSSDLFTFE